jgi:predicted RNA polymerase sigma factor
LLRLDDNPVVALNHAVAVSMVAGPRAGLELVQRLGADARINADRRFHAVRGHLLEMAGDHTAALEAYPGRSPSGHQPPATALPQSAGHPTASPPGSVAK